VVSWDSEQTSGCAESAQKESLAEPDGGLESFPLTAPSKVAGKHHGIENGRHPPTQECPLQFLKESKGLINGIRGNSPWRLGRSVTAMTEMDVGDMQYPKRRRLHPSSSLSAAHRILTGARILSHNYRLIQI
jgi:hypothetical protein